jgi:hypothetical protein
MSDLELFYQEIAKLDVGDSYEGLLDSEHIQSFLVGSKCPDIDVDINGTIRNSHAIVAGCVVGLLRLRCLNTSDELYEDLSLFDEGCFKRLYTFTMAMYDILQKWAEGKSTTKSEVNLMLKSNVNQGQPTLFDFLSVFEVISTEQIHKIINRYVVSHGAASIHEPINACVLALSSIVLTQTMASTLFINTGLEVLNGSDLNAIILWNRRNSNYAELNLSNLDIMLYSILQGDFSSKDVMKLDFLAIRQDRVHDLIRRTNGK